MLQVRRGMALTAATPGITKTEYRLSADKRMRLRRGRRSESGLVKRAQVETSIFPSPSLALLWAFARIDRVR